MSVKRFKPATPGTRFRIGENYSSLQSPKKEGKRLKKGKKRTSGRNNQGRRVTRYLGGGHKRKYRTIDFKRDKDDVPGTIQSIEYDPFRSAFVSLVHYADGDKRYILTPKDVKVGQEVMSGKNAPRKKGNAKYLKDIPLGTTLHNVELAPGKGGQLARSAGSFVQLTAKEGKYGVVKLPSGETRMLLLSCKATIGSVSNHDHILRRLGKAGRNRWRGKRPRTRGVAMNPIDHPMGGGEGRASGGHPRSRKGLYAKGKKTRKPNKASERLIIQRRKKKKKTKK